MGPGADMFFMLGGRINNQVLLGTGNDQGTISAGVIIQTVFAGDGADFVLWDGGNIGGLDMGADDDVAVFRNLTPENLRSGVRVDGGLGSDRLTWDNTVGGEVNRYIDWEEFQLTNGSQLTFSNSQTLTMGDTGIQCCCRRCSACRCPWFGASILIRRLTATPSLHARPAAQSLWRPRRRGRQRGGLLHSHRAE
jgi:hypothetical protein